MEKKQKKLLFKLSALVLGMFAFGFALVPLYNVFCNITGLNGKTDNRAVVYADTGVDKSRLVTVEFMATTNGTLPWEFYPLTEKIQLHPGEVKRVVFYAKNNSPRTMSVQAIPSVTPGLAAKHLKKTECFCFTRQTFQAGQGEEMPVLFYLDKNLPDDIRTIALSYTMFDADLQHYQGLPRGAHAGKLAN